MRPFFLSNNKYRIGQFIQLNLKEGVISTSPGYRRSLKIISGDRGKMIPFF